MKNIMIALAVVFSIFATAAKAAVGDVHVHLVRGINAPELKDETGEPCILSKGSMIQEVNIHGARGRANRVLAVVVNERYDFATFHAAKLEDFCATNSLVWVMKHKLYPTEEYVEIQKSIWGEFSPSFVKLSD